MKNTLCVGMWCILAFALQARADDVSSSLEKINSEVFARKELPEELLDSDISSRLKQANQRSTDAWRAIRTVDDWEDLRDKSIDSLRKSLGQIPAKRDKISIHVTREIHEDGYVIRNLVFESRPGLLVTANLYVPDPAAQSMPGILLSHSHHSPKSQGELQDMGGMWARAGCLVLVPDHLGHGERRQHPFVSAADYPEKFQVGRQDYHFRYNTAIQLYLTGESLMGWLAWDLMCGIDVLLAQPGVDPQRIALLGAVAGGGDPAAVAAALDLRITVVVPFNFGGPQPETRYPLPKDAEDQFDYVGGGSWESTRNLARSASDGFLPWIIVASVAPRGLIHAHEFSWDREHDPVWRRYQKIYRFYDDEGQLSFTHGFGLLRQKPPVASHCNNIGKPHRQRIHEYFGEKWGIKVDEERTIVRHTSDELACLTNITDSNLKNKPLYQLASELAAARNNIFLANRPSKNTDEWLQFLRTAWTRALGDVGGNEVPTIQPRGSEQVDKLRIERWEISGAKGTRSPMMLLVPEHKTEKVPVVLAISQEGKDGFLKKRSAFLSELLKHSAVCLVDLRGTGEMKPGNDRGRRSAATSLAASELMLGDTLLAARLRDLRIVLRYLRMRGDFNQIALFGDSLASANGPDVKVERPLELDQPALAEPLGPTLALLAGLFEGDSMVIAARGGLTGYQSILESQFIHVPFDAIVPGAAIIGDLPELAKAVGARNRLRMSGFVDGRNRLADWNAMRDRYGMLASETGSDEEIARWLIGELDKQHASTNEHSEQRIEKAKQFVNQLSSAKFDAASEPFDQAMKKAMSAEQLKQAWDSVVNQFGPFQRAEETRTESVQKYQVVFVTAEFDRGKLDVKVVFDTDNRITGLFFVPSGKYTPPAYVDASFFEESEVSIGKGLLPLSGTLSLPKGDGPFPAVVLVHGSGPHDRDETIGPNKPFRDLAQGLASRGIAVLRYEKRTRQHQLAMALIVAKLTVREETVDDAVAAVELLAAREKIDGKRIFVLGHSLGGMLLPRIGQANEQIAGFISLAGSTRPMEDLVLDQFNYILSLDGSVTEDEQKLIKQLEEQVARVKSPDLSAKTASSQLPLGVPATYWLDLRGYDPAVAAKELQKPMLILQGERDYQVTMKDFEGWKRALERQPNVKFLQYPRLNHLFIDGEGPSTPVNSLNPGNVAEPVIVDIAAWIRAMAR